MASRDIIVVGSSAGGVEALSRFCAGLPADLAASVFVAQHLSPSAKSVLPQLLDRAGPLPALTPVDEQSIERGHIYVAAPDHHILLREGRILMRQGPYENRTRPAVNALFRSAAIAYGGRVIGLVLTGLLDDGADGLMSIKAAGGLSVVQDPDEAEWPSMPRNAIRRDHVDVVARLDEMGPLLKVLSQEEADPSIALPMEYVAEDKIAAQDFAVMDSDFLPPGCASPISCPDCGGVLNEIVSDEALRFRCHVGHAFTPLGLAEAQNAELERALEITVRTHRDRVRLFAQMEANAKSRGSLHAVERWARLREESERMADVLEQAAAVFRKRPLNGDS